MKVTLSWHHSSVLFYALVGRIGRKPVRSYLFLNVFWAYHKFGDFINKVVNLSEIVICEKCSVCKMRQAKFEHHYLPEKNRHVLRHEQLSTNLQ